MVAVVIPGISSRSFQYEEDFWRVRNFLIEMYPMTPLGFTWEIRRWDGWRFHQGSPAVRPNWRELVQLWENEDGKLIGVAHPEGTGDLHLEVHPDYREIEEQMIAWGEYNLDAYVNQERSLETFVFDYDTPRQHVLRARGYTRMPYGGVIRRQRLDTLSRVRAIMPEGYHMRYTDSTEEDYQRVADLLNAAFNRNIHTAEEYRTFSTKSPSFRHLLNLVAEAPDGTFAAHVGVTYEHVNHYAVLEPVCTHPMHRQKGLARTLIAEGMERVKALGAQEVIVGTGDDPAANALYEAVGFGEACYGHTWRKVW